MRKVNKKALEIWTLNYKHDKTGREKTTITSELSGEEIWGHDGFAANEMVDEMEE